jgi:hypothetical protein
LSKDDDADDKKKTKNEGFAWNQGSMFRSSDVLVTEAYVEALIDEMSTLFNEDQSAQILSKNIENPQIYVVFESWCKMKPLRKQRVYNVQNALAEEVMNEKVGFLQRADKAYKNFFSARHERVRQKMVAHRDKMAARAKSLDPGEHHDDRSGINHARKALIHLHQGRTAELKKRASTAPDNMDHAHNMRSDNTHSMIKGKVESDYHAAKKASSDAAAEHAARAARHKSAKDAVKKWSKKLDTFGK